MEVAEIRRYPVKSMLGEVVPVAEVGERGLVGDRLWAVRDRDGKVGSGKNTRRFRRMPGLFDLRAYASASDPVPIVELPDRRRFSADDPAGHHAVGEFLGRPVTLTPEDAVRHHDEGPVSLITSASLRRLTDLAAASSRRPADLTAASSRRPTDLATASSRRPTDLATASSSRLTELSAGEPDGAGTDPLRFRANLLVDVPGRGFAEDDWPGRRLRIGPQVVLRVVRPLTRCAMIDMAQDGAGERNDLLKTLAVHHALTFGVVAIVEQPGPITVGDRCSWL